MVPYPRYNESWRSWDFRCKEYENDQKRRNQELNARLTNWGGYNYKPIQHDKPYQFTDGTKVNAVKIGYGPRNANAVRRFAIKNGLAFRFNVLGVGITQRTDGIAYPVTPEMIERYNRD